MFILLKRLTELQTLTSEYDKIVDIESRGSRRIVGTKVSACSDLALVRTQESKIT